MEQAVRKALKGLLLPDLQDIVLEYLPDRGTLVFPACWIADNGEICCFYPHRTDRKRDDSSCWLAQTLYPGTAFTAPVTFDRKKRNFEPFNLDLTPWLPLDRTKMCRVTVIYQGDPSIVEINTI
jgi:hypothetical protein